MKKLIHLKNGKRILIDVKTGKIIKMVEKGETIQLAKPVSQVIYIY